MKILIVDDSRAMQTIVRRGIEQLGYENLEVKKADNGQEALDTIRVWEPDLIISDWHMPKMSGLELLHELKREMLGISIGLVTTESSEKKLQEAINAGAQFVVQKPFDSKTLHEAVLPIIQGSLEAEAALTHHQEEPPKNLSDHIELPSIEILRQKFNALSSHNTITYKTQELELNKKNYPYLLGLYSNAKKESVHAVAIADINAACILGVLGGNVSEEMVHVAQAERALTKQIMDNGRQVLKELETLLHNNENRTHLTLRSANLMRKHNPNIEKLLQKTSSHRLDTTISIQGFGRGYFTLIVA